ncbi:MAG TPA: hypothetical protein VFW48_07845 [Solirubrobacterales bacterium]|nr:hypothetical protein [Solirubrobacterales bacterium]
MKASRAPGAVAVASVLVALVFGPSSAAGAPLQPLDLRVDGGEENWHAETRFALRWTNPPAGGVSPVAAVHHRLLAPDGRTLTEGEIGWAATSIQPLTVPAIPGAYVAEVWLEDASGAEGAPAVATLRFDDAAPGRVDPQPVPGWISRNGLPFTLRLGRPAGPEPLSGIRGYAVSIDRAPGESPCADRYACSETETDLRGGTGEDALVIDELSEGTSYVHAVAVSGSGVHSAEVGSTVLRVDKTDPETSLFGIPDGWSNRPLTLTAKASDEESGMLPGGSGGPFTAIRIDGETPVAAPGDSATATAIESGVHSIAYYARDAAGNVADGGKLNGRPNHEPETAVVRIDREPPRLAFANSQDPGDPERIEARADDSLSGVDPSRGQISVRPLGSGERFTALPTEVDGDVLRTRWDSGSYPPGEYEFRATAYDRAGNETSASSRGNGVPMRLAAPLKVSTTLRAGFGRQGVEEQRTVGYGRSVLYSGRLLAGRRTPLAGAPVRVIERFAGESGTQERVTTVRTTARGEFAVRLAPGPGREVVALSVPTATLRGASSKPLGLGVRAGLRLRVSSAVAEVGGRPVVFSGRVFSRGAGIPADGKAVELQFRAAGLPWSEFRTVRTDGHGRFRYAYRFADDDSRGVRFRFRAYAPAQAGWPFKPAGSAPVVVAGR